MGKHCFVDIPGQLFTCQVRIALKSSWQALGNQINIDPVACCLQCNITFLCGKRLLNQHKIIYSFVERDRASVVYTPRGAKQGCVLFSHVKSILARSMKIDLPSNSECLPASNYLLRYHVLIPAQFVSDIFLMNHFKTLLLNLQSNSTLNSMSCKI